MSSHWTYAQSCLSDGLEAGSAGGAALSILRAVISEIVMRARAGLGPSLSMFRIGEMICKGSCNVFSDWRRAGWRVGDVFPSRVAVGKKRNADIGDVEGRSSVSIRISNTDSF
jgi:hypothetical protein